MKLKRVVLLTLMSSILAVFSLITIPSWFLVPFTLQTLMISLIGLLLLPREAVLVVLVYLFVGGLGLPIFSNFGAGFGHFISPTGGFLYSFPIAALLISLLKREKKHVYNLLIVNVVMIGFVYLIGVMHYLLVTEANFIQTLIMFLPFILVDTIKNFTSYYIYLKINPLMLKQFS